MLRTVIAITAALTASHALAQPTPDQAASNAFSQLQSLTQPSMGQGLQGAVDDMLGNAGTTAEPGAQAAQQMIQNVREPGTTGGIADPAMAAGWQALRESLELGDQDRLYFFVSFSMPESLIRAYALDAARAGGELVLRGVEPGKNLRDFAMERVLEVLQPGGMTAPIQIDPRLFDAYAVEAVPSIVLAREDIRGVCLQPEARSGIYANRTFEYQACPEEDPDSYWKAQGSVTALYALEEFQKRGAPNADAYIAALRSEGAEASTEQAAISDAHWESVASELAERNAERLRERYSGTAQEVYDTPLGPAVGPAGQEIDHLWEE